MFGVVYSEKKTGRAYFKRTRIASFIKDREYRIVPEGCRLELITPRPNAIYEIKVDTPIRAKQIQQISLMDAPERSPKAGGILISPRKLLKITFVRLLDESDAAPEPELVEVPPDDNGGNGGNDGGNGGGPGSAPVPEAGSAPANPPEPQPAPVRNEAPAQPKASEQETQAAKPRARLKNDAKAPSAPAKPPAEAKKAPETKPSVEVKKAPETKPVAAKPSPSAKNAPPSPAPAAEPEKTPEPPASEDKTDSAKRNTDTEREEDSWDVQPDLGF